MWARIDVHNKQSQISSGHAISFACKLPLEHRTGSAPADTWPAHRQAPVLAHLTRQEYYGIGVLRPHQANPAVSHGFQNCCLPRQSIDLNKHICEHLVESRIQGMTMSPCIQLNSVFEPTNQAVRTCSVSRARSRVQHNKCYHFGEHLNLQVMRS
jgi:hypothetical protein